MNYLDAALILPLAWGAFNGFRKGLVIEIASLIALIAGIYGAMEFSFLISGVLKTELNWSPRLIHWTSFILTFIAIVIVIQLVARGIQKIVKMAALGTLNRVFGLVFGFVKFALLVACVLYLINQLDERYPFIASSTKEGSLLFQPMSRIVPIAFPGIDSI